MWPTPAGHGGQVCCLLVLKITSGNLSRKNAARNTHSTWPDQLINCTEHQLINVQYSGATLGCQHEWGGVEGREEHSEPLRSLHTSPVNASPQLRAMPLWDDTTDSIRCLAHSTFWSCHHTWSFSIELLLHGALDSA